MRSFAFVVLLSVVDVGVGVDPVVGVGGLLRAPCGEARVRCALRRGCGGALQGYAAACRGLAAGRTALCGASCRDALVALLSSEEGRLLVDCDCGGERACGRAKGRVEGACGRAVAAARAEGAVASCAAAHSFCAADTLCSAALAFYGRLCRGMLAGKACSPRCNNSISILQRQRAASKLQGCVCDGSEAFDCRGIKRNMAALCFHRKEEEDKEEEDEEEDKEEEEEERGTRSGAPPPPLGLSAAILLFFFFLGARPPLLR